jgi:hypothetical protein
MANGGCNNWTIAGSYALSLTGFEGTAAPFLPVSVAATRLFDGYGHFSGAGYSSTAGVAKPFSTTGKYQVNADCTVSIVGTITIGGANTQFGVIADNGNKIFATRLDAGETTTAEYVRIFRK